LNNTNKLLFLAFLITVSSMVSQSSAYTSAHINSQATLTITEDENALIALSQNSQPGDFKINLTNNLYTSLQEITIRKVGGDPSQDIITGGLMPASSQEFEIPESGNYIIEANWEDGSATLDRIFEVTPAPIKTGSKGEERLTGLPVVEEGGGLENQSGTRESEEGDQILGESGLDFIDGPIVEEVREQAGDALQGQADSFSTQGLNISRTMIIDKVKVNIFFK
jgi:hypothetical protein